MAATARNRGLQESPEPAIYVPYNMATVPGATFLLRDGRRAALDRTGRARAGALGGSRIFLSPKFERWKIT